MRRHTSLTSLVCAHASMQQLAVAGCARDESERKESPEEEYPCFYMRRGARGAVMTPRSLSLSTRSSFSRPVARDSTLPPCGVLHHTVAPSPFSSPAFSLPRWHFDIFSSSHSISTAVADPVSMPSIDPSQPPASTCSLPACVPSLSLRQPFECVSFQREKRSLVSCAIPHSPLPTFDFFPRGRSSDASQIH